MQKIIYWEKQGNDRMCALHCVNSLLQGPYFKEEDFLAIAVDLDKKEKQLMAEAGVNTEEYAAFVAQASLNASDDGFFNVTVLEACLKIMNVMCVPSSKPEMASALGDPCSQEGYICNLSEHWFCIRKIGDTWYNLDSLKAAPEVVSQSYLRILLSELIRQGYSLFVVYTLDGTYLPFPQYTEGLNQYQMYLTEAKINELKELARIKNAVDHQSALKIAQNDEEEKKSFLVKNNTAKEKEEYKWPETAGLRLDERNNNSIEDNLLENENDPELKEAILLSMQVYQEQLPPPVEEPENFNIDKRSIQVRLPNGKKIRRNFLKTHFIKNVFEWLEYDLLKENWLVPPLSQRPCYSLLIQCDKRRYSKTRNRSIELFDELNPNGKDVSNSSLEELGFPAGESFLLHY